MCTRSGSRSDRRGRSGSSRCCPCTRRRRRPNAGQPHLSRIKPLIEVLEHQMQRPQFLYVLPRPFQRGLSRRYQTARLRRLVDTSRGTGFSVGSDVAGSLTVLQSASILYHPLQPSDIPLHLLGKRVCQRHRIDSSRSSTRDCVCVGICRRDRSVHERIPIPLIEVRFRRGSSARPITVARASSILSVLDPKSSCGQAPIARNGYRSRRRSC